MIHHYTSLFVWNFQSFAKLYLTASLAPNVDLEPTGKAFLHKRILVPNELLVSILHMFLKLDCRLDEQSKRIQALSEIISTSSPGVKEPRVLSAITNEFEDRENKKTQFLKMQDNICYILKNKIRMKDFPRK